MTSPQKNDFDKTRYLYWLLGAVFAWQLALLTAAGAVCMTGKTTDECDAMGQRYESTFTLVISTVLALLAPAPLK